MAGVQDSGEAKGATKCFLSDKTLERARKLPVSLWQDIWKVARDDRRRVVHALKVGLALTLVSFLYLLDPVFKGIGQSAMWAVMTVVVVLEFTAGATLYKGLNRGLGTIFAGSLAFVIEFIAEKSGEVSRAIFVGTSVFLIGFAATYLRFFPYIKKNYDYGAVVFLLTFNLITVSSFRIENVLQIAFTRLYTIAIGCGICLAMTLFVLPNWSGEDLHNYTADKLQALARSIEVCVDEYFQDKEPRKNNENSSMDPVCEGYRAVLDSKSSDETLALFASWEPRHSRHCYKYPWQQYVKVGAALRHLGCTAAALHGCLESEIQTPQSIRSLFRDPCIRVAGEVSKGLSDLASSIKNHCRCSPVVLSDHLHEALQDLNSSIKSQPRLFLGPDRDQVTTKILADVKSGKDPSPAAALPSFKSDAAAAMLELRTKWVVDQPKEFTERKILRPTLSKIAITSLEFSEALPFAAFASLLVEMVARLELLIEEVEELGRAAHFKDCSGEGSIRIHLRDEDTSRTCMNGKINKQNVRDLQSQAACQGAE